MNTIIHSRKPLINSFPENSDLYPKYIFRCGYVLFITPFEIVYGDKKQIYVARISYLRRIFSVLRLTSMIIELAINKGSQFPIPSPGPMKVFIAAFNYGTYLIPMIYILLMNFPRTRNLTLDLLNLLSGSNHQVKNQQFSPGQNMNSHRTIRKIILPIYFYYIFLIGVMFIVSTSSMFQPGFRTTIRLIWNALAKNTFYSKGIVNQFRDMTWWMIFASFWMVLTKIDATVLFSASIVSILLAAKTLQKISKHFIHNLKTSQMYCVIPHNEILVNYFRVRRAYSLINTIFAQLTFLVIVYLSVGTCVMAVLAFTDSQQSFPFTTACLEFYFFSILYLAADATMKLEKMTKLLQFSFRQDSGKGSLQRAVVMFELGSSSVGLNMFDFFVVTYAFVASTIISALSNATIVLQSIDFYSKAYPPPSPPPATDGEYGHN